ncbi:hypothetical protein K488DRAFT_85293 [Vararia minispora EC-137]|uniref:Uncharacterized protein n=1 Tax=Vararia minispora EC-137 TaxID=1314806 RepID=A0ACB8QNT9_9AGAM|nr:hypothetical protein K488DRAFT_85293 [Vararia minispora EC-137]
MGSMVDRSETSNKDQSISPSSMVWDKVKDSKDPSVSRSEGSKKQHDRGGGGVADQIAGGADVRTHVMAPTSGPSPTTVPATLDSGLTSTRITQAQEASRVDMRASSDGCGLSLPLSRDGKNVLLGLAVVVVLIGLIALGSVIVQNRKNL